MKKSFNSNSLVPEGKRLDRARAIARNYHQESLKFKNDNFWNFSALFNIPFLLDMLLRCLFLVDHQRAHHRFSIDSDIYRNGKTGLT